MDFHNLYEVEDTMTSLEPHHDRHWLFEPGNQRAIKHGARSDRHVIPLAKMEFERLVGEHPFLRQWEDTAMQLAVETTIWALYARELDRLGVMDGDEPRSSLSKQVRLWSRKVTESRIRLGLDPRSAAQIPNFDSERSRGARFESVHEALARCGDRPEDDGVRNVYQDIIESMEAADPKRLETHDE